MFKKKSRLFIQVLLVVLSTGILKADIPSVVIKTRCDLRVEMRKLWEDHITWTRSYIISFLADLPDKDNAAKRLLKNQQDLGNAIEPFYGKVAAKKLTELLIEHVLIGVEIISDAKNGNLERVAQYGKKWTQNADAIAEFLYSANSKYWQLKGLKQMLEKHLTYTTEEVIARLNKKWDDDVVAYDKVHSEAMEMADVLSTGMLRQFFEK